MYKKVYVEITNNCNLNCDFCIKNSRINKFMSKDEFEIILNKLKPYTKYLYLHVLGEPLLHPKINEFINLANNYGYNINITTNGYLIDKIKDNDNIYMMNISLHSYNDKYNIDIDDYLNNIFDSVDKLLDNNTLINLRLWISNNNKYIIDCINKRYNTSIKEEKCKIKNNLYLDIDKSFIWPDLNNNYYSDKGKCYGLITHFGILVDGTIIPCCLDSKGEINLGNIFDDNLDKVLNSDRCISMITGFRNNKKCEELCKHCKFLD